MLGGLGNAPQEFLKFVLSENASGGFCDPKLHQFCTKFSIPCTCAEGFNCAMHCTCVYGTVEDFPATCITKLSRRLWSTENITNVHQGTSVLGQSSASSPVRCTRAWAWREQSRLRGAWKLRSTKLQPLTRLSQICKSDSEIRRLKLPHLLAQVTVLLTR